MVLVGEWNAHHFQSPAGLRGMSNPDFRRVPFAVVFRCFDGPQRRRSNEHHERSGFHKRVLRYQPAADTEENHYGNGQAGANNGGKNAPDARAWPGNHIGIVRSCHLRTGACYPASSKWSIGAAWSPFYDRRSVPAAAGTGSPFAAASHSGAPPVSSVTVGRAGIAP